ncbi:MAG TPA: ATP synthase F0 subunit B [Syntrophorhabdaceae bacterium]|jgi:F-type H+-transporting ATPase subunit b
MIKFDSTLLVQFANILVVMVILNFFLFKPVLKAIEKRRKTISSLFEKAGDVKQETVKLEKTYDEETKERRKPILEVRDTSMAEAHNVSQAIIDKARKNLADELARFKAEIGGETTRLRGALMADVEKLAGEAAQKILKRSV